MHLWWQVLKQKSEDDVYGFGLNHMVVIEDKDKFFRDSGDFVEQDCQSRFDWRLLRGLEDSQHAFAKSRHHGL